MMLQMTLDIPNVGIHSVFDLLKANNVFYNDYAEKYISHPNVFRNAPKSPYDIVICSLSEIGFADGAKFNDISEKIGTLGMYPCHPLTGVFLRLQYKDQTQSSNSVLTGINRSPDGAIVVYSDFLKDSDSFPKGLYLRNVDGLLWLRGYVCDDDYWWSPEDTFAFSIEK